jgi:Gas vesicle protein
MMSAVPGGEGAIMPTGAVTVPASDGPTNLGEVLERVLDKGVVIAGDIQINLLDIELLTIKLRLIVASVETARRMGLSWWERDPWLTETEDDGRSLRERIGRIERQLQQGGEPTEADG